MRVWMHAGFYLLLASSAARYVARHGWNAPVLGLAALLAVAYAVAMVWRPVWRPRRVGLLVVAAVWLAIVLVAPSFALCAVPLVFVALDDYSPRTAVTIIAVLTAVVVLSFVRLNGWHPDVGLIAGPAGVAIITTAAYLQLARTSQALAESRRRAGALEERARLARDLHDTVAQGMSSVNLLLQAADRAWPADAAQANLRQAMTVNRETLGDIRTVVMDLNSLQGRSLEQAIADVCAGVRGPGVRFAVDGDRYALPESTAMTLLRIAQGALANVVEHAHAQTAAVTLSYLPNEVRLDVVDDGVGFNSAHSGARPPAGPGRGFGLEAIARRAELAGGRVTIESEPGRGTAIAVAIPAEGASS
ncbi:signal transduction histidine kinase [Hamadaea flava]|uniref:Oxygen sensor histidine kinase NreB n=1 Tax=Hamadaea flava TaxID=1742688 RepID=A0ABV8LZI8_9ACTN|nr:sensor histidine kinase [Hamadaea flava]MCP2324405.1 signal transduction histidine kinase [Hamadaea flava]